VSETYHETWRTALEDPFREKFVAQGPPDFDAIVNHLPRLQGSAALDQSQLKQHRDQLAEQVQPDLGHPLLDEAVLTGLASIDVTFEADHPRYGCGEYAYAIHDGFPGTIIATVDALLGWDLIDRAKTLLRYYLKHFVRTKFGDWNRTKPGDICYYAPSISDYGQLLTTAIRLARQVKDDPLWTEEVVFKIDALAERLLDLCLDRDGNLLAGVPEADTRKATGYYFHNNAWACRALIDWSDFVDALHPNVRADSGRTRAAAFALRQQTLDAINRTWPADPDDWWLPPLTDRHDKPKHLCQTQLSSYTNYRYWPELLSSGILPADLANRLVNARLAGGGQFMGMSRFEDHLDDWPMYDYLLGLWQLDRRDDFLFSLYGHVAYHLGEGHLTAYEQVTFPPGGPCADYCLPCQLVVPRAAALLRHEPNEN